MSQPSVTVYFNNRKRQATDELGGKSKVLLLEHDYLSTSSQTLINIEESERTAAKESNMVTSPKVIVKNALPEKESVRANKAVRNIHFDSPKTNRPRTRATRACKLISYTDIGQTDIRDSILKMNDDTDTKKVPFEKKGMLSPKKKPTTPKKNSNIPKDNLINEAITEQSTSESLTPKKQSTMRRLANHNLSLNDIKNRINKSSRLMELKASIERIKNCEQRLEQLSKDDAIKKPKIQKFEKIQLEIPVR